MAKKKLHRYHKSIFYPEWSGEVLGEFTRRIFSGGSVVFSVHAVDKIVSYSLEYGKRMFRYLIKGLKKSSLDISNIFEFYAVDKDVRKACFRFTFEDFPVDLVLVISSDGTVITVFVTNKGDNHQTMNSKLYAKS